MTTVAAKRMSKDPECTKLALQWLSSRGPFDFQHMMAGLTAGDKLLESVFMADSEKCAERDRAFKAHEATALRSQRHKEDGWSTAVATAHDSCMTSAEAHLLGGVAFKEKRLWAAEMFWTRSIALGHAEEATSLDKSKARTSRSHVRTILGRRIRSQALGNLLPATTLIEGAIADAQAAILLTPNRVRGYIRHARALLALGPDQHALEASRVIAKALVATKPGDGSVAGLRNWKLLWQPQLQALHVQTKSAACCWNAVKANTSPDDALNDALLTLDRLIVAGLAIAKESNKDVMAYGRDVVAAVSTVAAILRAAYADPKWICTSDKVQFKLRACAKCLSLQAVHQCPDLKALVFMEGPWTLYGLDLLDRAGVDALEFGSPDPFAEDKLEVEDPTGDEIMTRETGVSGALSNMSAVKEMIDCNPPRQRPRDMTQHNICSFSLTVIHRIFMRQSDNVGNPLFEEACTRMIAISVDQEGSFAGGEFLGYALTAAAGVGKHGIPSCLENWNVFKHLDGSMGALAVELFQSGDSTGGIAERLNTVTPAEWSQKKADDVQNVLQNWILRKLNGTGIPNIKSCKCISAVLAKILEGHPELTECLQTNFASVLEEKGATDIGWAIAFTAAWTKFGALLCSSPFGIFFMRHYEERHQTKAAKISTTAITTDTTTTRIVVKSLVRRWQALSHRERAGYRWESLSKGEQERLAAAGLEPKSAVDTALSAKIKDGIGKSFGKTFGVAVEIRACGFCGLGKGANVKLRKCNQCMLVDYCSTRCQKKHWCVHKPKCLCVSAKSEGDADAAPSAGGLEVRAPAITD